jgi:hypothetical protein
MSERAALTRLTGSGNGECGEKDCPNVYCPVSFDLASE